MQLRPSLYRRELLHKKIELGRSDNPDRQRTNP